MTSYSRIEVCPYFENESSKCNLEELLPDSEILNGYGLEDFYAIAIDGRKLNACVYRFTAEDHEIQRTKKNHTFALAWSYEDSVVWIPHENSTTIQSAYRFRPDDYSYWLGGNSNMLPGLSNFALSRELGRRLPRFSEAVGCGSRPPLNNDWSSDQMLNLLSEEIQIDDCFRLWDARDCQVVRRFTIEFTVGQSYFEYVLTVVSKSGLLGLEIREDLEISNPDSSVACYCVLASSSASRKIGSYLNENF